MKPLVSPHRLPAPITWMSSALSGALRGAVLAVGTHHQAFRAPVHRCQKWSTWERGEPSCGLQQKLAAAATAAAAVVAAGHQQ
jgi:hypothetical protein